MKTVLLTGATGFLGSHLLKALLDNGYKVVITKRSTSNVYRIENLLPLVDSYDLDLCELAEIFESHDINIIINTICNYGRSGESIADILEANLMMGVRLLNCAIDSKVDLFINTDTLLDRKINIYSLSKGHFAEYLDFCSGVQAVVNLKIEHMYGKGDDSSKFIGWLLNQFNNDVEEVKLTSGEQVRDFVYVSDVVSAYMIIINNEINLTGYSEFEIGTGNGIEVRKFVETLKSKYVERHGMIRTFLKFGAMPYRQSEKMKIVADIEKLTNLGWKPMMTIENGIENILEDIR